MAKRNIKVLIGGHEYFSADDCDVCVKGSCVLVHRGDVLFAYALMPGQYVKFEYTAEGAKVKVDA